MVHQKHGFIITEIFEEWCWEVLFPERARCRDPFDCQGEAVLIMDGLSCRRSDLVEDVCLLQSNYIIEILFAQSSDQTQTCDFRIFGAMKASTSPVCLSPELSKQSKQVIEIVGSAQTTLLAPTIVHAFSRSGIRSRSSQEPHYFICHVHRDGLDPMRRFDLVSRETAIAHRPTPSDLFSALPMYTRGDLKDPEGQA
jgi:hypothetical protein